MFYILSSFYLNLIFMQHGFCRCYAVAVLEDRKYSALAPFGGFAFMAAWASLLV